MVKIGDQFREERMKKNLTLEEVARATKIKEKFLRAIENSNYDLLPSPAYANGFVKNYAKYLDMPIDRSMAIFRREYDVAKKYEVLPKGIGSTKTLASAKYKFARTIILIGIVLIFLIGFISYQYRSAFFNPTLKLESPTENATISTLSINVKGKTDPSATLYIDDQDVVVQKDGSFSKEISVFPGPVTIEVKSENRFGRVSSIERNFLVVPNY